MIVEHSSDTTTRYPITWTKNPHKVSAFNSGICSGCATGGKTGTAIGTAGRVFQMSSIPQTSFGKLDMYSKCFKSVISANFPHFHCELRVLRALMILFPPHTSARRAPLCLNANPDRGQDAETHNPQNPLKRLDFHSPNQPQGG